MLHFEALIEASVSRFSGALPSGAWVLDAGAGESRHAPLFARQHYVAVDLGVGDVAWDYTGLDIVADLTALPFKADYFDACLNVVTLEHVREPACALREMARVLKRGGRLLLIVPHEWEVHQAPHDYFRYTRHGITYLLERAGFEQITIAPAGGYFRLMSRRIMNGLQFFSGLGFVAAAVLLAPVALLCPLFDRLDRERNFTLGYICEARKPA